MNFELTDEQKLLNQTAYKFALNELQPIAKECDREEKYPHGLVKKAGAIGLVGCFIPEKYGGPGFGVTGYAMVSEQLSRVDLGLSQVIASASFGSENILFFGSEEQKQKYLPDVAEGRLILSGAYTEPDAGTDLASAKTTAVRDGNEYVINGNKMFITNGNVADLMVVLCVTNPKAEKKHDRFSIILVEADRPGIIKNKIKGKMGLRASDTAEVTFEDVRVPCENLIGQEGKGFYYLMHFFDVTRIHVASEGVGLAQGALDKTLKYVQERTTFGRPLAANQAVQFMLAEMATKIEMARNAYYKAAWKVDNGQIDSTLNAMTKYFSAEMAVWVCDKALQLHGGYGYIDEYDIQRFYRDAKVLEIYEGAKEAEKMAIARRLF